jgi:hypothetical protein
MTSVPSSTSLLFADLVPGGAKGIEECLAWVERLDRLVRDLGADLNPALDVDPLPNPAKKVVLARVERSARSLWAALDDKHYQSVVSEDVTSWLAPLLKAAADACLHLAGVSLANLRKPQPGSLPPEFVKRTVTRIDVISGELGRFQKLLLMTKVQGQDKRRRMTIDEANSKATQIAKKMKKVFIALSITEQARQIGCHIETWKKTKFYSKAQQMRPKAGPKKPRRPKTVSMTRKVEATVGQGKKNEVLEKLIAEQNADMEPSPLESDHADRPRTTRCRKRL